MTHMKTLLVWSFRIFSVKVCGTSSYHFVLKGLRILHFGFLRMVWRAKPGSGAGILLPVLEYCRWGWLHWLWEEIMSYQGFCYLLNHTEMSCYQANGTTLTEPHVPPESRLLLPPPPAAPCKILQSPYL